MIIRVVSCWVVRVITMFRSANGGLISIGHSQGWKCAIPRINERVRGAGDERGNENMKNIILISNISKNS